MVLTDGKGRPSGPTADSGGALGELIVVAIFCASCWLAVGLLVFAAIMLSSGWLVPLLVALALLVGAGAGLFPTMLFRQEAREAEAAFRAIAAEAPDQVLFDARAREPDSLARMGAFAGAPEKVRRGRRQGTWWSSGDRAQD